MDVSISLVLAGKFSQSNEITRLSGIKPQELKAGKEFQNLSINSDPQSVNTMCSWSVNLNISDEDNSVVIDSCVVNFYAVFKNLIDLISAIKNTENCWIGLNVVQSYDGNREHASTSVVFFLSAESIEMLSEFELPIKVKTTACPDK